MAHSAVIDVGSNTIRLLVAHATAAGIATIHTNRVRLDLGHEIEERGHISDVKLAAAAKAARTLAGRAHAIGVRSLDVVVTAPGRQAENAKQLVAALEQAAQSRVRVLSPDAEARLAFLGAVSSAEPSARVVAVVDLGGASTEIAIGRPETGPAWVRSVDLGALRLTSRFLRASDPDQGDLEAARQTVREAFAGITPPLPTGALAVGGSARALRSVVGAHLGPDELADAEDIIAAQSPKQIKRRYGVGKRRARQLLAATLILREVQRRLFVPLEVTDGGLREGVLLAAAERAAA
jgi:exopolyphosphatase / guanosine-5'-triphosphate,3'-diphosphate pyrophosphatase